MQHNERLKVLFYQNYPTLCHVAYQYVMDQFIAEDIVQETFIKFWENNRSDLPDKEAGYYLTRAVKNNSISYLRKKVEHVSLYDNTGSVNELSDEDESEQLNRERIDQLETAIQQLPPRCKEVFLLCKMEQKKYREIAIMLNISVKTVENQMTKAVAFLRSFFREDTILLLLITTTLSILHLL